MYSIYYVTPSEVSGVILSIKYISISAVKLIDIDTGAYVKTKHKIIVFIFLDFFFLNLELDRKF